MDRFYTPSPIRQSSPERVFLWDPDLCQLPKELCIATRSPVSVMCGSTGALPVSLQLTAP